MQNVGLDESQAGIRITQRNINNLRYADDTTQMAKSEEELKSLWIRVKESEKAGLQLHIQKTKIMAFGSYYITANRCGKCGNSVRFHFLGSKINVDGDCSHKIKRRLLLGRIALSILDILLTKVHIVKAMVFPVVMYGCESWIIKKAEHRRIDAFKLWC